MSGPFAFLLALITLVTVTRAETPADKVMLVRLFHGQNEGIRDDLSADDALKRSLITLIGYQRYEEIGSAYASLEITEPQFVVPCRAIFVKFQTPRSKNAAFTFELFHSDRSLLRGEFIPRPSIPLIITGPFYDKGRLVLVMIHCPNQKIPPNARAHLTDKPEPISPPSPLFQASPVSLPSGP